MCVGRMTMKVLSWQETATKRAPMSTYMYIVFLLQTRVAKQLRTTEYSVNENTWVSYVVWFDYTSEESLGG